MRTPGHNTPPKWASWFLEFYCKKEILEEVQGDLHELYEFRIKESGFNTARLKYVWDVFRFLKLSNIKNTKSMNSNFGTMLNSYFLIARRNLWKEKGYSAFNLLGLYIGFLSLILTAIYVDRQFEYDAHHSNADETYRFLLVNGETGVRSASTAGPWAPTMLEELPEMVNYVRVGRFSTSVFQYEDKRFYETEGILADPSILDVFNYDFKWGNPEAALDDPFTVVISEAMATKYFGDRSPIGEYFSVNNDEQYRITGVLAAQQKPSHMSFDFMASFDSHQDDFRYDWIIQTYTTYIQLAENTDIASLENKLIPFFKRHTPDTGVSIDSRRYSFEPVKEIHLYSDINGRTANIRRVMIFAVLGILILIIALLNYVSLVTARSTQRLKEVGVRKAIGAQKRQLVVQFLSEGSFFCFSVFLMAIISANVFLPQYATLVNDTLTFALLSNGNLVLLLLGITVFLSMISSFYPAVILSAIKPINLIGVKGGKMNHKNIFRYMLTGIQFAISIALIIGIVFVNLQLNYINQKDLGFDKDEVMIVTLRNTSILPNKESFAERLRGSSYIKTVGMSGHSIGGGDWGMPFRYEGGEGPLSSRFMAVDAGYANAMGLEFVSGRNFSSELATDVDKSYIVNEAFLKAVGWTEGAGKGIEMPARNADGSNSWAPGTVVGVVKDFNYHNLRNEVRPLVISNRLRWTNMLFIKLDSNNIEEGVAEVQKTWESVESELPFNYYFLDDRIDLFYAQEVRLSRIATIYGVIAILLACFGLFSLATFIAEQKMKEVSIRKVLGATVKQVFVMFSKSFFQIVIISSILAIPVILYFLDNWLTSFAYRIEISDYILVPIIAVAGTILIALFTIVYQCIRIARVNPVTLLKSE